MPDMLIRDIPEHVLAALDTKARRLGLSRSEYVRRQLAAEAVTDTVTPEDLTRFADTFADLGRADVMTKAWE